MKSSEANETQLVTYNSFPFVLPVVWSMMSASVMFLLFFSSNNNNLSSSWLIAGRPIPTGYTHKLGWFLSDREAFFTDLVKCSVTVTELGTFLESISFGWWRVRIRQPEKQCNTER